MHLTMNHTHNNPKYLLADIDMSEEEADAAAEVVRSKWLSMGPRTADFENAFARKFGTKYAVAVSSCTAALHLSLMALNVSPGDEIIVPSYSFVASANPILYQGAKPVFIDICGQNDLNLDPKQIEKKISKNTKAIIVVHLAGFPADMDNIMTIADKYQLKVIEDASHAIGADYLGEAQSRFRGLKAGTIGHIGCFSFFANKNLSTGEGGMVVTNDKEIAQHVQFGRSHGMTKTSWDKASGHASDYDVVQLGYNYRCTEITSILGLIQLQKLSQLNEKRRRLAEIYHNIFLNHKDIVIPFSSRLNEGSHHIYPIVLPSCKLRQPFRELLSRAGIQTSIHYPPIHLFSHYRKNLRNTIKLPMTEDVSSREVTLPLHPLLKEDDVVFIANTSLKNLLIANKVTALDPKNWTM